jgi:hypothetical protein
MWQGWKQIPLRFEGPLTRKPAARVWLVIPLVPLKGGVTYKIRIKSVLIFCDGTKVSKCKLIVFTTGCRLNHSINQNASQPPIVFRSAVVNYALIISTIFEIIDEDENGYGQRRICMAEGLPLKPVMPLQAAMTTDKLSGHGDTTVPTYIRW